MNELSQTEIESLHELLRDEITEFGYTCDVSPNNWLELEYEAVRSLHKKVLEFEANRIHSAGN